MRPLLGTLARAALARPGRTATAALAPLIAFAALVPGVPLDLSFGALMDRSHPEVARYLDASESYGLGGIVLILLDGPEAQLDPAIEQVTRAVFDPLGSASIRSLDPIPAPAGATPGRRLLRAVLEHDPLIASIDADDFPRLRAAVDKALQDGPVAARFAGMAAIVTEEQEATLGRMRWLAVVSLALVVALLSRIDRRPLRLLSAGAILALSAAATLGIVGRLSGRLTLMESLFGVLILGLGADFAIHWLLRAREERAAGRSVEETCIRATEGTGRGILAGALTSGSAFLLLTLAPEPVFQRLGLAGGVGLLIAMIAILVLLPIVWAVTERSRGSGAATSANPAAALSRLLLRASNACARAPLAVLSICGVALVASVLASQGFHYEGNLERVFSRDIQAVAVAHEVRESFGVDPQPWLVRVADMETARQVAQAFEASDGFERAVVEPELGENDFGGSNLGRGDVGGGWRVSAFARTLSLDAADAAEQRRVAQSIHPDATSMAAVFEALIGADRPWMAPLTAVVVAVVVLILLVDLRSPRLLLLALLPVTVGGGCAFGLLCASGFAWNTVTLVGLPLLVGLGVDDGIHLAHRIRAEPGRPIGQIVGAVGPAIVITTATTCASVAALLWSRHPGIESLAVLLGVGLPACLLASVTALPAAAVALRMSRVDPLTRSEE